MANYPVNKIRNVCLMGHGGDGKTSLVESLLNIAGVTDRVGKIADGNTVCDFDPEEIKRKFSISTAVAPVEWNGCKINLLDTPGFFDFESEVQCALRVAESALIVALRFGIEDGHTRTLEEVGKEFNVTRERIRQIEAKALRKLRHPSRSKKLKDFLN